MFTLGTPIQAGSITFSEQVPPDYSKGPILYGITGSPTAYLGIVLLSLPLRFTDSAKLL